METLTAVTPYDVGWVETDALNIGGDSRRAICLYNNAGVGNCDGTYNVWCRRGTDPWVRVLNTTLAATSVGHAIVNMEQINCFNKLYVSMVVGANADRWFLSSGSNQGYE